MILLPLSPSAVQSHRAIKREEPSQGSAHLVLQIREILSSPCVVSRIADLDTEAKVGTKIHVSKFEIGCFGVFLVKSLSLKAGNISIAL